MAIATGTIEFTKMHGCENDYLVVDAIDDPSRAGPLEEAQLIRAMCDRHSGVGADGVIVLSRPVQSEASARMRIFNADGSDGGMCGNGARCAAKLLVERGRIAPEVQGAIRIELTSRIIDARVTEESSGEVRRVRLGMGRISFEPANLPMDPTHASIEYGGLVIEGRRWGVASVGNPHAVAFVDEQIEEIDLGTLGPLVEHHPAFPVRTNAHIVNITGPAQMAMRSWERGSGETRACGSGACVCVALAMKSGLIDSREEVIVRVLGGELVVGQSPEDGSMWLEGPAQRVFQGAWPLTSNEGW